MSLKYIMQTLKQRTDAARKAFHVHFASMLTAITRAVSPGIVNCELTFVARESIEHARAEEHHRAYERLHEKCGARVVSIPPEPALPQ